MLRCTKLKRGVVVAALALMSCMVTCFAYLDIPNDPPEDAPFYGAYYIRGYDNGQQFTIYTNTNTGWGVDDNGYLYRLGGSATGIIYIGDDPAYTTSLAAYNLPRYRTSYTGDYISLQLVPESSNIVISDAFDPVYDIEILWFCAALVLLGLLLIVNMRKGR